MLVVVRRLDRGRARAAALVLLGESGGGGPGPHARALPADRDQRARPVSNTGRAGGVGLPAPHHPVHAAARSQALPADRGAVGVGLLRRDRVHVLSFSEAARRVRAADVRHLRAVADPHGFRRRCGGGRDPQARARLAPGGRGPTPARPRAPGPRHRAVDSAGATAQTRRRRSKSSTSRVGTVLPTRREATTSTGRSCRAGGSRSPRRRLGAWARARTTDGGVPGLRPRHHTGSGERGGAPRPPQSAPRRRRPRRVASRPT